MKLQHYISLVLGLKLLNFTSLHFTSKRSKEILNDELFTLT